jgi:ArsR family transcriptional regulator
VPSAFNTAKLWAAYADSHKRTRFFIPVLDPGLSAGAAAQIEPSAVFKALGDTTRYAIASMLARTPMTSVELARAFDVSKPTISHHVQQLRAAGLLEEAQGDNGVVLSLNRRVLEKASGAAAREMFSGTASEHVVKRSRRVNKS